MVLVVNFNKKKMDGLPTKNDTSDECRKIRLLGTFVAARKEVSGSLGE